MASRYQLHVEEWKECTLCSLSKHRTKVVIARGTLPCDVLFIGEAPGDSEDVVGKPFVGPAGKLLDRIVLSSLGRWNRCSKILLKHAFTNVVCCKPLDDDGGKEEPLPGEVDSCSDRLRDTIVLANPRLIVAVGGTARDYLDVKYKGCTLQGEHRKIPQVWIKHPAAILRANVAQQGMDIQRCIVTVYNALEDVFSTS